jgi:hypothetical protein
MNVDDIAPSRSGDTTTLTTTPAPSEAPAPTPPQPISIVEPEPSIGSAKRAEFTATSMDTTEHALPAQNKLEPPPPQPESIPATSPQVSSSLLASIACAEGLSLCTAGRLEVVPPHHRPKLLRTQRPLRLRPATNHSPSKPTASQPPKTLTWLSTLTIQSIGEDKLFFCQRCFG